MAPGYQVERRGRRTTGEWGAWQTSPPKLDRCCICNNDLEGEPQEFENRPTGTMGRVQRWAFCVPCYDDHLKVCDTKVDDHELLLAMARAGLPFV